MIFAIIKDQHLRGVVSGTFALAEGEAAVEIPAEVAPGAIALDEDNWTAITSHLEAAGAIKTSKAKPKS